MRIFRQIAALAGLNLFSCAEVAQAEIPLTLNDVSLDAMRIICSYLDNPFSTLGNLNRHFKELFSTELSAKVIFKERFDIPELVTDEIGNNEPELKFIISSFSKFKNPGHLYGALRNEFLFGTNFNVLIPNLLKYFDRYNDPNRNFDYEVEKLALRKKFDVLFELDQETFEDIHESIFLDFFEKSPNLQEYLVANPHHLERINTLNIFLNNDGVSVIVNWIKVALVTGVHDSIFKFFPQCPASVFKLQSSFSVWTNFYISEDRYPEISERINFLIDNLASIEVDEFDNDNDDDSDNDGSGTINSVARLARFKDLCRLYTLIRFGPENENIFEEQIAHKKFKKYEIAYMCHCACLANKKDLFLKLLPVTLPFISTPYYIDSLRLNVAFNIQSDPIQMHKFIFEIYKYSNPEARRIICIKSNLLVVISNNYRIIDYKRNGLELEFVFNILPKFIGSGFPESITINRKYDDIHELMMKIFKEMIFDNADVLERLIADIYNEYKYYYIKINTENLRLMNESESIQLYLRQKVDKLQMWRYSFLINPYSLLEVVKLPITNSLAKIVGVAGQEIHIPLHDFKSTEQLSRLEIILDKSVSTLLKPEYDYFRYRHVFKYLIECGKPLPVDLSENTRALLLIDYPTVNFNL